MEPFVELLQVALGKRDKLSRKLTREEWRLIYEESEKQTITGVILKGLEFLPAEQRPPQEILLQWIGVGEVIRNRNYMMDKATVHICKFLRSEDINYFVFKGQTLSSKYPDNGIRQSGDIDFYCQRGDWKRAIDLFVSKWNAVPNGNNTEKDVEFEHEGISYEMHKMLTMFMYPKHGRYWEKTVMPEISANLYFVKICGYNVPTLSPTYNMLYVFVHIFQHLISDGIGLRQFVDWFYLFENKDDRVDYTILEHHLNKLGLKNAFKGMGVILTDYFGLEESKFPYKIDADEHKKGVKLMRNIIMMGNFGHNKKYAHPRGIVHGLQHMFRIIKQAALFGHYAPAESWWRIPHLLKWWLKKIARSILVY